MDTTTLMGAPEPATSGIFPDIPFGIPSDGPSRLDDTPGLLDEGAVPEPADDARLDALGAGLADPALTPRELGALGEDYAARWLETLGWRVLERNWRSRYGEIDIVALSPELRLVFVEVKTRRTTRQGTPQEAVTASKRASLRRAGVQWLVEPAHRVAHTGVRFDVLAVLARGGRPLIRHIPGAF